ncbi:MAG: 50S ribosomal protein L5 [Candidatus Saccharimonadales bacterium]
MNRLQAKYQNELVSQLQKELKLSNVHQVPRIEKVVINVGAGRSLNDSRILETAKNTLCKITGQQPVVTTASKSIAGFKLREGQAIGTKVTLRGQNMYEFLDRLISIVLPRTRDFRGLSVKAFDPHGNYSLGLTDQSVFPELSYEDANVLHGLQINVVTNSNPAQAQALLHALGLPFERSENG